VRVSEDAATDLLQHPDSFAEGPQNTGRKAADKKHGTEGFSGTEGQQRSLLGNSVKAGTKSARGDDILTTAATLGLSMNEVPVTRLGYMLSVCAMHKNGYVITAGVADVMMGLLDTLDTEDLALAIAQCATCSLPPTEAAVPHASARGAAAAAVSLKRQQEPRATTTTTTTSAAAKTLTKKASSRMTIASALTAHTTATNATAADADHAGGLDAAKGDTQRGSGNPDHAERVPDCGILRWAGLRLLLKVCPALSRPLFRPI